MIMQIKNSKLRDLYERYMNFINGNYISAVINETTNTVSISYSGELARIFIKVDNEINSIVVKITQDPTKKMSKENGKIYYMSTIDEMNSLIAASKVIMDLKISNEAQTKLAETANAGQGYLLDVEKNVIGVVDLKLIPTNAFVYDSDKMNIEIKNEHEQEEEKPFRKTIFKFFS
jgi:hypothetical protein